MKTRKCVLSTIVVLCVTFGLVGSVHAEDDPAEKVVRQFLKEVWSKGDLKLAYKVVHPDYQFHHPAMRIVGPTGPDLISSVIEHRRSSFSDLAFTIDDLFSEGDRVVARWTAEGTHDGKLGDAEPTGKKISYQGISIYQVAGDQIYQEWVMDNFSSVLRQLGIQRLEVRQ